ncbi:MAG TPA: adenylate/guanylate cyclase domain-containing protein, partial [Stellaceae bacterium]|nr:adenylate/guanylate cyclase domain-containing protein [Stellaceae bacterium]
LDSRELARTLNDYFDGLSEVVVAYDGTIGKFEGDAVFVIFNAPVDQHDHAERAVRCALEIDRFAESYRIEQNAHNIPFGRTRIGIHTGPAVVGNFGSRNRFDYSANGDAVNTAARLEGVNKQFGTRICISDATRRDAPGIEFRPLGAVVVKGKSKGIAVWEPLHADGGRDGYLARWRDAYAKLEAGAAEAELLLADLKKEDPADKTVALHLDRLRRGERGVELVLTEK